METQAHLLEVMGLKETCFINGDTLFKAGINPLARFVKIRVE
jgi:hypothetical protein